MEVRSMYCIHRRIAATRSNAALLKEKGVEGSIYKVPLPQNPTSIATCRVQA